jgi:membrane protease YdiL (CAAX protease family)
LYRCGWKEIWICFVQAAIFMSAHLYFKDALPFEFWVVVPLAGLILSLLAWRSGSIDPGMLAHAAFNGSAYLIFLKLLN